MRSISGSVWTGWWEACRRSSSTPSRSYIILPSRSSSATAVCSYKRHSVIRSTKPAFSKSLARQSFVLQTSLSAPEEKGPNPFQEMNLAPRSGHLPNTRLETFVFETSDLNRYVSLQEECGAKFLSDIQDCHNYYFIQTEPSPWTGNSLGFIQWKGEKGVYSSPDSQPLDLKMDLSHLSQSPHLKNIRWLDHAATRVKAQDRNHAILEFLRLTNYNFDFAIHVKSLNSITSVARLTHSDFAMVFTSGITPYVSLEASGPTEKFIRNYGPRVHHIAFQTEEIEETTMGLEKDGMKFLLDLTGSREDGLKQIFSKPSQNTLQVTEYIHRYGDFDGFFTESNVTRLTAATGKQ